MIREYKGNRMRILRFDSVGGASGDMILGALIGLGVDSRLIETEIHKLIPEHFHLRVGQKSAFGASGVYLTVDIHEHTHHENGPHHSDVHEMKSDNCISSHDHDCIDLDAYTYDGKHNHHKHSHGRTYAAIRKMLEESSLCLKAKTDALAAFNALAMAESEAHNVHIDEVHFHEIGAVDSIVDTVGCALALSLLNVDGISLSPLPVGEGTFKCAHGVYPLPAPATAVLLRNYGLRVSHDNEQCEMLTPTATSLFAVWNKVEVPNGAKIIATVNSFGTREMKTRPNLLRATLYEAESNDSLKYNVETLCELETNIDDATGERLACVATVLFGVGALDVWFEPIQMKKGRPANRLGVLVSDDKREQVLDVLFKHSSVLGVRMTKKTRYSLERTWEKVDTQWGQVRVKIGSTKFGEEISISPEFEDVNTLAVKHNLPFDQVFRETLFAFHQSRKI